MTDTINKEQTDTYLKETGKPQEAVSADKKTGTELYIGLMSGTSMDGMNAALVEIDPDGRMRSLSCLTELWPEAIKAGLHALCQRSIDEIERLGPLQNAVGAVSALCVRRLLEQAGIEPAAVRAIGSHGQTVRHRPAARFTLQLDNAPLCALLTHIDTWSDFRCQDVAAGGEGAPLTPLFHQRVFASPDEPRLVINLGGITNVTALLPGGEIVSGWDTGPANTLMDLACRELVGQPFDRDGRLAAAGTLNKEWLKRLIDSPYFIKDPPKSCGREEFSRQKIAFMLQAAAADPSRIPEVLNTLCLFSVGTLISDLERFFLLHPVMSRNCCAILCGGGIANRFYRKWVEGSLGEMGIRTVGSDTLGIDPFFVEAQAFAYFAYLSTHGRSVDLSKVTGSQQKVILGSLSPAPDGAFVRAGQVS